MPRFPGEGTGHYLLGWLQRLQPPVPDPGAVKPRRIFLVRHGESVANVDLRVYETVPDHRIPLTPRGHQQARGAGEQLRELLQDERLGIYGSPFHRARQTRNEISAALDPAQIAFTHEDPRLREQEYGHLREHGKGLEIDREQSAYGVFYFRIPDGESGADALDRMTAFIGSLFRGFDDPDFPENILIVSHGLALRLFWMSWYHWNPEMFARTRAPANCDLYTMEKQVGGRYRLTKPCPELPESEWPASAYYQDASPQSVAEAAAGG